MGTNDFSQETKNVYQFMENFNSSDRIVRLDKLICDGALCVTHLGPTFIYRDEGHLSYEGSALLGEKFDFYKIITGD